MLNAFSASPVSLRALFSGRDRFTTPDFQRPYSWTVQEVSQLVDDLLAVLEDFQQRPARAGVFFLGTIVLIEQVRAGRTLDAPAARRVFEIIDGQQRLVTLTLIFAVLRELARAEGNGAHADSLHRHIVLAPDEGADDFQLTIQDDASEVLRAHVQQMDGCLTDAAHEDFEGAGQAIIVNRQYLMKELRALDAPTRQQLAAFVLDRCQLVLITTDELDSAFRIFMVVNQLGKPLTRHDILKADLISQVALDVRPGFVRRWQECERKLGQEFENLFSHLRSAIGRPGAPIIAEVRKLARDSGGGQAFLDQTVLPMSEVYAAMLGREPHAIELPDRGRQLLSYLNWLGHADWVPPALLWLMRERANASNMLAYLEAADRFAFGQLLLGVGRNKRITRYGAVLSAIRGGITPVGDKSPLGLTADDQKNILFNAANNIYARNPQGCKLLLIRLNDEIAGTPCNIDPTTITVEHILPQRPGQNSPWRDRFPASVRDYYTGSLGNLILISPKTNKEARNHAFNRKLESFLKDQPMAELPINGDVLRQVAWGPDQVQAREDRLLGVLRQLWGLNGPTGRKRPGGR